MNPFVTYSGWIATIVSTIIAVYQMYRYSKLIRKQKEDIWKQIEQLKAAMREFDHSPLSEGGRKKRNISWEQINGLLKSGEHNLIDFAVITAVEVNICAEFRSQLQIAIALERKFNLSIIEKWYKTGKLSSKWQVRQACQLLDMKNVTDSDLEKHKKILEECEVSTADEVYM